MKKIKLSVAALLIAGSGYCNGNDTTNVNNTKEIIVSCEDMIEWIRNEDINNDRMSEEIGELYIDQLYDVISKTEDLDYNVNTK